MAEYNKTIIDEDAVEISSPGYTDSALLSVSFILMVIKCAAPLCIIVIILCCLHSMVFELKKFKKEKEAA